MLQVYFDQTIICSIRFFEKRRMTMKANRLILVTVLVISMVAQVGIIPTHAQENVVYTTGTEVPASPEVCYAAGGVFDPGDGACVLEYLEFTITPDGKHLRASRISYWRDESSDERLTGYNTVKANLYMNLTTGVSRMWGTFSIVPDGDGWQEGTRWHGSWEAHALPNGKFFMVGYGEGMGSFQGLRLVLKDDATLLIGSGQ
jgi:hypothetical protein